MPINRDSNGVWIADNGFSQSRWGGLRAASYVNAPRTITAAADSPTNQDTYLIANRAGTVTLTLPSPAGDNVGKRFVVKTIQAQTVVSAASDVCPAGSATPGTAILAGTAGKCAELVSDGTNWVIFDNN